MSENQLSDDQILITLLFGVSVFIILLLEAYFRGKDAGERKAESEAVKAGHAEYYLDSENNRQWRWK